MSFSAPAPGNTKAGDWKKMLAAGGVAPGPSGGGRGRRTGQSLGALIEAAGGTAPLRISGAAVAVPEDVQAPPPPPLPPVQSGHVSSIPLY